MSLIYLSVRKWKYILELEKMKNRKQEKMRDGVKDALKR